MRLFTQDPTLIYHKVNLVKSDFVKNKHCSANDPNETGGKKNTDHRLGEDTCIIYYRPSTGTRIYKALPHITKNTNKRQTLKPSNEKPLHKRGNRWPVNLRKLINFISHHTKTEGRSNETPFPSSVWQVILNVK